MKPRSRPGPLWNQLDNAARVAYVWVTVKITVLPVFVPRNPLCQSDLIAVGFRSGNIHYY